MNAENDRAVRLGQEAESLESKALDVARSASLNAVGLGDKKGRFLSAGGLVVDGLDAVKLRQQAKEKRSEQSFAIQSQKRYENEAKGLERKIKNLERRLDRMGCN